MTSVRIACAVFFLVGGSFLSLAIVHGILGSGKFKNGQVIIASILLAAGAGLLAY